MGRALTWLKGFFSGGGSGKVTGAKAGSKGENAGRRWGLSRAFGENKLQHLEATAAAVRGAKTPERTTKGFTGPKRADDVGDTPRPSTSMAAAGVAATNDAVSSHTAPVDTGSAVGCRVRQVVATAAAMPAEAAAAEAPSTTAVACHGGRQEMEWAAAVAIQSAFRRHLARKALKALRGLVKIQALLRGHITRKKITEEYRCRVALARVQHMAKGRVNSQELDSVSAHHHSGPHTPEKHELPVDCSFVFRRDSSRVYDSMPLQMDPSMFLPQNCAFADSSATHVFWGRSEAAQLPRPSSATSDHHQNREKILVVDSGNPHHHIDRRLSSCGGSSLPRQSDARSSRRHQLHPSPSKDSNASRNSLPSVSPSTDSRQSLSPSSFLTKPHLPSESATDSVRSSGSYSYHYHGTGFARRGPLPFSPARSRSCTSQRSGGGDLPGQLCPSYMAYTESSKAKARRYQSVPKQRPDAVGKPAVSAKRLSQPGLGFEGGCGCHHQSSSMASESTCAPCRFPLGKPYPGSGRLDRFGMPIGI